MSCLYLWMHADGVTHFRAVVNPAVVALFRRAGYRLLSYEFTSVHSSLPCTAVLLHLNELSASCRSFIERHHTPLAGTHQPRIFLTMGETLDAHELSDHWPVIVHRGETETAPTGEITALTGAELSVHCFSDAGTLMTSMRDPVLPQVP